MKALADYVHCEGTEDRHLLLAGPEDLPAEFAGSYQHEEQDART